MALSLVSYGDSDSDHESEVMCRDSSSTKPDSNVRKLLSVLPPSKGAGKRKVKIGLPTIYQNDSDSDDDDLPVAKKPKKSGGSGLTALLPEPKGGVKELGSGKRSASSTKTMVPYTLSKRYQDSKKKSSLKKGKPLKKSEDVDDSDSDGETPVSFFSLNDSNPVPKSSVLVPVSDTPILEHKPPPKILTEQNEEPQPSSDVVGPSLSEQYGYSGYYPASQYHSTNEQYAVVSDPSLQEFPSQYPEVSQQYPNVSQPDTSTAPDMAAVGPGLSIDEEQLRRLAGVRRGRKRDEGLNNITEIRGDDVQESIRNFQKYHTEDSVNKYYQVEASKLEAPTGQQKRKHQLSYLAHQAKANELELSKHWAQAAATRKQTQMKYGF